MIDLKASLSHFSVEAHQKSHRLCRQKSFAH
jgi:hypothetical protein